MQTIQRKQLRRAQAAISLAVLAGVLAPDAIRADDAAEVKRLRQQLEQIQADFERQQQLQRQQMELLKRQIEALEHSPARAATDKSLPGPVAGTPPASTPPAPPQLPPARWNPADPIRLKSGNSSLDLSAGAGFIVGGSTAGDIEGGTQLGGHDPKVNGFTLQGFEIGLAGAVDPYFRAQATVLFQLDSSGESRMELEEAFAETSTLPGNITLRAGQFFSNFGRHNPTHPHQWSFVDVPVVNGRLLGGDGLRNPGAQVSWLLPTRFFSELSLGIQNSQGETASSFRSDNDGNPRFHRRMDVGRANRMGDLLFTPRLAASFELTDSQTLLVGSSAAFGPNASGRDSSTQVYGVDAFWKWKPSRQSGGFPFVSWQTEALVRRYEAGAFDWDLDGSGTLNPDGSELDGDGDSVPDLLPRETLTDYGFYSQVAYGFTRDWVVALRGDYADRSRPGTFEQLYGDDAERLGRWRVAPNLTWYPSHFSRVRLQYNLDRRQIEGTDHSVWLQMDFSLGAHASHSF